MDDLSFRAQFHRAFDPIAPPAPWLAAAVRDGLRARRQARPARRGLQRLRQPAWLLPALAALLVIAIIVAVVVGSRLLNFNQTIPVGPPHQHGLAAPGGCPAWGDAQTGSSSVASDRMISASTGWVSGAVRTTDGGADWRRVVPTDMLTDAPPGTDHSAYPPGYTDYFLDARHAWLAYALPSATSCFDHVTVFATYDGGRSWRRSNPISAAIQVDTGLQLALDFIDPQHGWLFVLGSGRIASDGFLYATSNGGVDWQLLAQLPQSYSLCGVSFVTLAFGYLTSCGSQVGSGASVVLTRNGGQTWQDAPVPVPFAGQFGVDKVRFFDEQRGVAHVTYSVMQGNTSIPMEYLAATGDGGQTWHALPAPQLPGYDGGIAFADPTHFYELNIDQNTGAAFVYRTSDGGLTWSLAGGGFSDTYGSGQLLFVDAQHGFIDDPGQQPGQAPRAFYSSTDGGKTWRNMHPRLI